MWTNVFKIGGLHQISWFQFLPHESSINSLPERSIKAGQKDAATLLVLSAHLQLQKEGFLSTWTNSFVGPWDPSQGLHNPDEKIKLWLFLPGRRSSVVEKAQSAVSRLRVIASGLWLAPGDSEEVAAALSQALKNCLERPLLGLSYMRFGEVFSKHYPLLQCQEPFRGGQPVVEFVFAATEEAIFVHAIISMKNIRALSRRDIEIMSNHATNYLGDKVPVVVSPHGMRGRLAGCCPSDLVKNVYLSTESLRASNGIVGQSYSASQGPNWSVKAEQCYVEVVLCGRSTGNEKVLQSNPNSNHNLPKDNVVGSCAVARCVQESSPDQCLSCQKTFIYPAEAVIVPVIQSSLARSALKRFWLQNWMGPSLFASSFFMQCDGKLKSSGGSWFELNGFRACHGSNSSSNSNSSSISSISSTSSDSDYKSFRPDDLEADADSLTCRQPGLSSADQLQNDGFKAGSKRQRVGVTESFSQGGTVINPPMQEVGAHWDWDDDDGRGMGMDIQALLSEFGDFGDFFESDTLPFGEPPGTAESEAIMFSPPDGGDANSSPCTIDVSDQMLLQIGLSSFESVNAPVSSIMEESQIKNQETTKNTIYSGTVNYHVSSSSGDSDHLIKAEALLTFAPEYGAVDSSVTELSSLIFTSPYIPRSRKVESANSSSSSYVYSATPPSSPCFDGDEKPGMAVNLKAYSGRHDAGNIPNLKNCYSYIENGKKKHDERLSTFNNKAATREGVTITSSSLSNFDSSKSVCKKLNDGTLGEISMTSMKTVVASDIECVLFQAFMCRIRHTLLSSSTTSVGFSRLSGSSVINQAQGDASITTDVISSKFELKKKESIPVRIAGDIDGGILDGPFNAPVGVWRSVGFPKGTKSTMPGVEVSTSLPHNSLNEEGRPSYGQRRPLQELLDGMTFLVQHATSFVDLALDADFGDGPYGWLALQEQWRRGFSCGPAMVHAGCGGLLASCHTLDIAGVELLDPLSMDVNASSTISLLQSDIKAALKSAFGTLDGPLSVIDWCKVRSQCNDTGTVNDVFSPESPASASECRDSSSTVTHSVGEQMSPSQSAGGSSCLKDGNRVNEISERKSIQETCVADSEQQLGSCLRPSLFVLPYPAILVGYQDDWLKTSTSSLQLWEKAPFEPYATQKHMAYCVVCPDIDPLTTAASEFFQQLSTVYETCNLGTHSPQSWGNHMEIDSGKCSSSSGFLLLDCPQSIKIESSGTSMVGSISDYFLSLSRGWNLASFLKSLSKILKSLKLGSCLTANSKEGSSGPCTVIYIVCPFPEPVAVLQTLIESSVAVGSVIHSSDKERRSLMHNQVGKALSCAAAVDEASISNVPTLSGFSISKLVVQIVTVESIFRIASPALNELVILKEIAFTVYNKARRYSRGSSNEAISSSNISGRSHSVSMQMSSPMQGMWKDCVGPRITGPISREGDLDTSLRSGSWDNSWQISRPGVMACEPNRSMDFHLDEQRFMFEPLFILAEPGSLERGISTSGNFMSDPCKPLSDDGNIGSYSQVSVSSGSGETGPTSQIGGMQADSFGPVHQKTLPSLHCCYGWTEDWRWLVCIWTDSRGELLDTYVFPFGGISSRQDTKGLQSLFVLILQKGCQILQSCSSDSGVAKPRDFIIARIGSFFELECQEWQKALYSVGGSEVKKWPLQLRRSSPDGISTSSNGTSLQQQEMTIIHERTTPSSPSPLYSPQSKSSAFVKGGLGQSSTRKQLGGGNNVVDNSRGLLQWVQSISFVSISVDHSLQLVCQAGTQGNGLLPQSYLEGFTPVKSLGSTSESYILIPSPSMHFLPPTPLQLPTCLTAESPPLAHLLHSKGTAIPLCTGFVVSRAVRSMRKDSRSNSKYEWPSILAIDLVDYYGGRNIFRERIAKGVKAGGRSLGLEAKDFEIETHIILESLAAELHALSWMTASPTYIERRSALPFHCDIVLRLRRLLHFADKELSRQPEK